MPFDFLGRIDALDPANLTIREQVRLAENPNDLRWRAIFPKVDAPSVKLSELSLVDFRPAGGRREWNAQGLEIPEILGTRIDAEMVPINPTHHLDERRLQHLRERVGNTGELYNRGVIKDVDSWASALADAADRQIERDAFELWFQNQVVIKDPKTGTTETVSGVYAASRYVAASATFAAATNAYTDFMGYLRDARSVLGSVGAVRLRQARLTEILADAPAASGDTMSLRGLQERLNAEGFGTVAIVVDERTYDELDDGGSAYTQSYYVPTDRMAIQPATGVVGRTHFAPVTRAYDYMDTDAVETLNDFSVFYGEKNDGKTLLIEAQANALALPVESAVYVVTGIA